MFPARIRHNGGSPLGSCHDDRHASRLLFGRKRTVKRVWALLPGPGIAWRQLPHGLALGMPYRRYTIEIMERDAYRWT
jgi:hypothetical protein